MKINSRTQLLEDFTDSEACKMLLWAEDVVLRGEVAWPDPPFVPDWLDSFGYDERQRLLVISTALPARVLLSLLRAQREAKPARSL